MPIFDANPLRMGQPQQSNSIDPMAPDAALTGLLSGLWSEIKALRGQVGELREQLNNGGQEWPLTSDQVGEIIGVKAKTVESRYLAAGRIKAHKGGRWLVYPCDLHRAIARNFEPE